MNQQPISLEIRERRAIQLLVLLAALHVYFFSGAFPFFNVVDEQEHLDLVVRYSNGDIPRSLAPLDVESLRYVALFGTPEYLWPPSSQIGGVFAPPPWTLPIQDVRDVLLAKEELWKEKVKNHEASQPPLYYSVAGFWWRLCGWLGFQGGTKLYLLRFFNIIPVVALVLVGRRIAARLFPENYFIRMAVPSFIALMPQTAFYSINNDVFSPLIFALMFLQLLKFQESEVPAPRRAFWLGLAFAGTFLTKISNLPLLAVTAVFVGWKIRQLDQQKKLAAATPALAILVTTAALPITAWMVWCKTNFGDFTGSILKIQFLGWTNKPFLQWFHHPIFTPRGFWTFVSGNLSTLWQGEFLWQGKPLAFHDLDRFYVLFTLVMLLITLFVLLKRRATLTEPQRMAATFGFACLLAMFAFFALLSVKYDFHDCYYPSTAKPYFTSGRLMLGLLVPFLILIALGLDRMFGKDRMAIKFTVLVLILVFMVGSEINVDWKIFPNPYNWYHM